MSCPRNPTPEIARKAPRAPWGSYAAYGSASLDQGGRGDRTPWADGSTWWTRRESLETRATRPRPGGTARPGEGSPGFNPDENQAKRERWEPRCSTWAGSTRRSASRFRRAPDTATGGRGPRHARKRPDLLHRARAATRPLPRRVTSGWRNVSIFAIRAPGEAGRYGDDPTSVINVHVCPNGELELVADKNGELEVVPDNPAHTPAHNGCRPDHRYYAAKTGDMLGGS